MDKVKVNNQVVKMRKHVKRAKLFAINRFTKQLKQLQTRKGNDNQAEKNQRKVERLLEKIKILKKMMPDFVSKKALSKAQDWNNLLTQKNVPLEDQCLALLASDVEIQKEVEKFYAEECQLVEKIPTLLLEWEVKSKMPKSPDKKKKASDIKKQKLDKMAQRKKSNFKGASYPNNVAVNRNVKTTDPKKKLLSENVNMEDVEVHEKNQSEKLETIEVDSNDNDQLDLELADNSGDEEAGEFFAKAKKSRKCSVSKRQSVSNDELDLESADNSCDDEAEEFFIKEESQKRSVSKNQSVSDKMLEAEDSPSNAISSDDEESEEPSIHFREKNVSSEIKSTETTCSESLILERLKSLANTDPKRMKAKNKSNSQNTKAIKVLDLNQLQNSDVIPIQSPVIDPEELGDSQIPVPKKDSFFLNGDGEVESSDDESNTNNYRDFRPKRKFSNFDQNARDDKFKRNNFGDKSPKSFNSFKGKDFNQSKNGFPIKRGKDFNRDDNRFQNKKEEYSKQNGSRFQKNTRGDFQFKNNNRFEKKSERNPRQLQHSNSVKRNDTFNQKRENKQSMMSKSFQSNEKAEKNVNLHPSWEAKNKLKEAAKSGFKGKRIVFD